jgi:hypothetical protein
MPSQTLSGASFLSLRNMSSKHVGVASTKRNFSPPSAWLYATGFLCGLVSSAVDCGNMIRSKSSKYPAKSSKRNMHPPLLERIFPTVSNRVSRPHPLRFLG